MSEEENYEGFDLIDLAELVIQTDEELRKAQRYASEVPRLQARITSLKQHIRCMLDDDDGAAEGKKWSKDLAAEYLSNNTDLREELDVPSGSAEEILEGLEEACKHAADVDVRDEPPAPGHIARALQRGELVTDEGHGGITTDTPEQPITTVIDATEDEVESDSRETVSGEAFGGSRWPAKNPNPVPAV